MKKRFRPISKATLGKVGRRMTMQWEDRANQKLLKNIASPGTRPEQPLKIPPSETRSDLCNQAPNSFKGSG